MDKLASTSACVGTTAGLVKTAFVVTITSHTHVSPEAPAVIVHESAHPVSVVGKTPSAQRTRNLPSCSSTRVATLTVKQEMAGQEMAGE